MKSTSEKEENVKLWSASECSELHNKFAIKNINALICASYLITIVIALTLTSYIHFVDEHQSREIQNNFEKLENELLKLKDYNNRDPERLHG